jgi:hypothetical protein
MRLLGYASNHLDIVDRKEVVKLSRKEMELITDIKKKRSNINSMRGSVR